jgi:MFS transporter, FSR family, fosmidomycin resistance protein
MSAGTRSLPQPTINPTIYPILLAISFSHLLNDTIQSLIPSIYPLIKNTYQLNFAQIGMITLTFQLAASLLQPFVGFYTDKKPQPFSLATGMAVSLMGLVVLSIAHHYYIVLIAVTLIGIGSSVFHPEASKVAYMASGGKRGLAQSIFQVGGNAGSAIGPLLAALIIVPYGQQNVLWFSLLALLAIIVLYMIGKWYTANMHLIRPRTVAGSTATNRLPARKVTLAVIILLVLIFSKYFYLASMSSYYTFFLIDKFHLHSTSATTFIYFPGSRCSGYFTRRTIRRSVWPQICDLVFHLRRCAFHARITTCTTCIRDDTECVYRIHSRICFFCHPCIRTGTDTWQDWYDLRAFLWICFWHGRYRICVIRSSC